ncbi:hypothetical protein EMA8858_01619 [Emticicia aquatica]|uniref:Uncharacterized protein n=2 Tax=Emticicia aquatica TaxID=1681835 RepID=A0ABM9ANU4_9BACT|nr:hypothetical protein EMA8858_01619 [Emticicia aquatica]
MRASELIKLFSECYPYLRLEIYHRGEEMGNAAHNCLLKDIVHKKAVDSFEITPQMKVCEVEEIFWEKMGLQISIFRKSGKTWLESSFTNYWSLERQNNLGKEMNDFMNIQPQKVSL